MAQLAPSVASSPHAPPYPLGRIILILAAIQFATVLQYAMLMPLGPDFAADIGMAVTDVGLLGAAFTLAAAVGGLASSAFLDRFDRKTALAVSLLGVFVGGLASALAPNFPLMVASRLLAGAFSGPVGALVLAIISDVVPTARRGRAMGTVMSAVSLAIIFGMPFGLALSHWVGWRFSLAFTAGLMALLGLVVWLGLPRLRGHLGHPKTGFIKGYLDLFNTQGVWVSFAMIFLANCGQYLLTPSLSPYVLNNLHFPREHLSYLYFVGGLVGLATMMVTGRLVDKVGPAVFAALGSVGMVVLYITGFIPPFVVLGAYGLYVMFMFTNGLRMVPTNTLTSQVPDGRHRARFMSLLSAVQNLSGAVGMTFSAHLLYTLPDHTVGGMDRLAWVSVAMAAAVPFLLVYLQRVVRQRQEAPQAQAA